MTEWQTVFAKIYSRIRTASRQTVRNLAFVICSSLSLTVPKEDASENESEGDFVVTNKPERGEGKSSAERQEALRRMMDDEGKDASNQ